MNKHKLIINCLFGLICLMFVACGKSSTINSCSLKINQVGYYPNAEKVAVLEAEISADLVQLLDASGEVVWEGVPQQEATSPWSGRVRRIVDFSEVVTPGEYTLRAGDYEQPVRIAPHVLADIAQAAMKAFYLQRSGMAIEEQYAGMYARPLGHPDTLVYIHEAAATPTRPAESTISSPYGWYDAGDYNKYIVNSGFAIGVMLAAYELAPDYYNSIELNIPESGNDTPDFLDEIYYNLRWMLTMQDEDGGVYHKLTEPDFEGFIRPIECQKPRYVTQKGTAATLDFAATMAMAARIYSAYPAYATFSAEALASAKHAFEWAEAHPFVPYDQPANNEKYALKITTGAYDDEAFEDEFFWAATELFFATQDNHYQDIARRYCPETFALPVWGEVSGLGYYEWIIQGDTAYVPSLLAVLDERLDEVPASCFRAPYGNRESDFGWGCNGEFLAGQGVAMLVAYNVTHDKKYLVGAMQDADYLLGRNATGYCYVTGFGTKRVMHPHHRLSGSDDIEDPLPGFLVGGPNPKMQDLAEVPGGYLSAYPDEAYMDVQPSYASNEVAINWQAYLVALLWGVEAVDALWAN